MRSVRESVKHNVREGDDKRLNWPYSHVECRTAFTGERGKKESWSESFFFFWLNVLCFSKYHEGININPL